MMRIAKLTLVIFSIFLLTNTVSIAQNDIEYKETLHKMIEISGSAESFNGVIDQMIGMLKQQYGGIEPEIWDEFANEFSDEAFNKLVDQLIPVYKKHLTIDDLNSIIEFYQTPAGKKYAEKTPMIIQESMQVGQQWGAAIGQDFAEKMKEKGY